MTYKILVTTVYGQPHTLVIAFETKEEADEAVEIINTNNRSGVTQRALALYQS